MIKKDSLFGRANRQSKAKAASFCAGRGGPAVLVAVFLAAAASALAQPCPPGYVSPDGMVDQEVLCPAGYYAPSFGMTAGIICPAGAYAPLGSITPITCPAGSYAPQGSAAPTTDPCGTYSSSGASSATQCPGGTYSAAGASAPTTCPAGYYAPAGSCSPIQCPAGHYAPAGSAAPTTDPCGTYSSAGASAPSQCPGGTYSAAGASIPSTCPGGYYAAAGSCSPTLCPAGYYAPAGSSAPTKDPVGYYSAAGAISPTQSPAGYYTPTGTNIIECPPGYFAPAGATSPTAAATNYFVPTNGAATQTPDPAGTWSHVASAGARSASLSAPRNPTNYIVGPIYFATPSPTIDLTTGPASLSVSNASSDLGSNDTLTALTLISATLSGGNVTNFQIAGFATNTVLYEMGATNINLSTVNSSSLLPGTYSTTLTVQTDQSAPYGTAGDAFAYTVTFTVPMQTLTMASAGPTGLVFTWTNANYVLQSAPTVTGVYTNMVSATSPYTNAITGSQQFFRLVHQ